MKSICICLLLVLCFVGMSCRRGGQLDDMTSEWEALREDGKRFRGKFDLRQRSEPYLEPFSDGMSGKVTATSRISGETFTSELTVVSGKPERGTSFRDDGTLHSKAIYTIANNATSLVSTTFTPEGGRESVVTTVRPGKNGSEEDTHIKGWHSNGTQSIDYRLYRDNGGPCRHGKATWWNIEGEQIAEGVYSNGVPWRGTFEWGQTNGQSIVRQYDMGKHVAD